MLVRFYIESHIRILYIIQYYLSLGVCLIQIYVGILYRFILCMHTEAAFTVQLYVCQKNK